MPDSGQLSVTPSDVLYSADYLESIGHRAVTERRALSVELCGHTTAWQDGATAGYSAFIGLVGKQADRMATEIADAAGKLRDAAHAYVANEHRGAENLRWDPTDI